MLAVHRQLIPFRTFLHHPINQPFPILVINQRLRGLFAGLGCTARIPVSIEQSPGQSLLRRGMMAAKDRMLRLEKIVDTVCRLQILIASQVADIRKQRRFHLGWVALWLRRANPAHNCADRMCEAKES